MRESTRTGAVGRSRRRSAGSGLGWGLLNSVVSRAGQLVVGVVLARLLAPEDFGLFAVALVAFAVVVNISELGVTVVLVRTPGDIRALVPTVLTLALASGAVLGTAVFAGASWFAALMEAPDAAPVLRLLAIAVVVAGASAVPGALLQRDFRQDLRMRADMTSFVVSTALTIGLVLGGFGALGLAWGRLAGAVAALVALLLMTPPSRPGWDRQQVRGLLLSGLPLAGASLLAFALLNADYVVVSKELGTVALGLYVLAFNLSSWPVAALASAVRGVALPALAELTGAARGAAFVQWSRWLATASLPVCVLLAVLADDVVTVVYGARWQAASPALVALAALGACRVALELAYGLQVAAGKGRAALLVNASWLAALVPALVVGARLGGLRGVGVAHAVVVVGLVLPLQLTVLRRCGVDARYLGRALVRPVSAAAGCGVAASLVRSVDGPRPLLLAAAVLTGLVVHVAIARPLLSELHAAWSQRTGARREVMAA
jgi:PST family polysaccharide transporter